MRILVGAEKGSGSEAADSPGEGAAGPAPYPVPLPVPLCAPLSARATDAGASPPSGCGGAVPSAPCRIIDTAMIAVAAISTGTVQPPRPSLPASPPATAASSSSRVPRVVRAPRAPFARPSGRLPGAVLPSPTLRAGPRESDRPGANGWCRTVRSTAVRVIVKGGCGGPLDRADLRSGVP